MGIDAELAGLKETQERMTRLSEKVSAKGGLQATMAKAIFRVHSYASKIVHVLTGRLKNSLYPRVYTKGNQAYGVEATNLVYARVEHDRGGDHAYFQRTIDEDGPGIVAMFEKDVQKAVKEAGGD